MIKSVPYSLHVRLLGTRALARTGGLMYTRRMLDRRYVAEHLNEVRQALQRRGALPKRREPHG